MLSNAAAQVVQPRISAQQPRIRTVGDTTTLAGPQTGPQGPSPRPMQTPQPAPDPALGPPVGTQGEFGDIQGVDKGWIDNPASSGDTMPVGAYDDLSKNV